MIFEFIFWICLFLLLHSYVLYPILLMILSIGKKQNQHIYNQNEELPEVSVLLAVHNEETVVEQKILSTFNTSYPLSKIKLLIGSDASTDNTLSIIQKYQQKYPNLILKNFETRTGKATVINSLARSTSSEVLVLTDANVMFDGQTIFQLVKHLKNTDIGLVASNIINNSKNKNGISLQETTYLEYEKFIKYLEGITWGTMIGAFGGCYAIRKIHFLPVPPQFLMDDFYISMNIFRNNQKAIHEYKAICYEDVSNLLSEEFRRKIRISAGNFQNLHAYKKLLWPPFTAVAFSFFSHKILRWIGPLFIVLIFISNTFLIHKSNFYLILFFTHSFLLFVTVADFILQKINFHIKYVKFVSHFYLMNLALLLGFLKYIKGIKTNIWEPTMRNQ